MESTLVGHGIRVGGRDYEIVGMSGGDHYSEGGYTVFDMFDLSSYTFLKLERNQVTGNVITAQYDGEGVYKLTTGLVRGSNAELGEQGARLHIKPTEPFVDAPANREFLVLTLTPSDFSDFASS